MPDRPLKLRELVAILKRYGVEWDPSRGKGGHGMFSKQTPHGYASYAVPTSGHDIQREYVRGVRKKFKITSEDGVSDQEFYHNRQPE